MHWRARTSHLRRVNHELLCTAVMYAEGCERRASFFMWTGSPTVSSRCGGHRCGPVDFTTASTIRRTKSYLPSAALLESSDTLTGADIQSVFPSVAGKSTEESSRQRPRCSSRSPRRCTGCTRSCGALHDHALWQGALASHKSESISDVPLLELRRSSLFQPYGEDTLLGAFHDLLDHPITSMWYRAAPSTTS